MNNPSHAYQRSHIPFYVFPNQTLEYSRQTVYYTSSNLSGQGVYNYIRYKSPAVVVKKEKKSETVSGEQQSALTLSKLTGALLMSLEFKDTERESLEDDALEVSKAVSFFGFLYEKLRNAVEFSEEHLIRRMTISRILKRRLLINPQGKGEAVNLIRELLWGRYLSGDMFSKKDAQKIQYIINRYLLLYSLIIKSVQYKRQDLKDSIIDLLSCEIEEEINKEQASRQSAYLYYFYQTLKDTVTIQDVPENLKDIYFYIASEKSFSKNDASFISYHIFTLHFDKLALMGENEIEQVARNFPAYKNSLHQILKNPYDNQLSKYAKRHISVYRIMFYIIENHFQSIEDILTNQTMLKKEVERVCSLKYQETGKKIRDAAIRSIIYIFLTKMIFVVLLEIPLSIYLYDDLHVLSLIINTLFPPILMGLIVSFISVPSDKNTHKIFRRMVDLIQKEGGYHEKMLSIGGKSKIRRPTLLFIFTIFYIIVFSLTFYSIYAVLDMLGFNIISKAVFVFFISVVAYFGYRVRQTAKEYVLEYKDNIIMSIASFLFLPVLSLGKILSSQIAKINFLMLFFDTLIEAPFKVIIDIIEEWVKFIKARKDEIL